MPNRCTGTIARVRPDSAGRTVSAVTQKVSGSTSQNTGTPPALTIASAVASRVSEGQTTSSPGPTPDPERDRERVGAVAHADHVLHAEVGGELLLEALDLGAEDEAAGVGHGDEPFGDAVAIGVERGGEKRNGHVYERRA